jgi:hypothetical protein
LLVVVLGATAFAAAPEGSGPPGNNGTVKIDGTPWDDHPNNEPHVGCTFQVDFYGYDEGDLEAAYQLELWAPTGHGTLDSGTVAIGEDAAGGGTDLDASVTIDLEDALTSSGQDAHPQQGWHVRLTVHAEGSIGADVKHKMFWVDCATAGGSPSPTVSPTPSESVTPSGSPSPSTRPTHSHSPSSSTSKPRPSTSVLGESGSRTHHARRPGSMRTAFTGTNVTVPLTIAITLLLAGALALRAASRRAAH